MVKNSAWLAAALALVAACDKPDISDGRFQGMVEHEQVDLAFEVPGRLVEVPVAAGQDLAPGALVARLDDLVDREGRDVRAREVDVAEADLAAVAAGARAEDIRATAAQLAAARAAETSVTRERERTRALVTSGALGGAVLDEIDARVARATGERQALEEKLRLLQRGTRVEDVARARARVAQAGEVLALEDARLGRRTLTAPVGGAVVDVYVRAGEMVAAGTPVASIIDRRRPYADVFVPVAVAPTVRAGDPAFLAVEGLPGEVRGTVERVFPRAEFTPRFVFSPRERPHLMIRARVRLDDPDGQLHAGLPAYARFGPAPTATTAGTAP